MEVAFGITSSEIEVFRIRIAQAHVALGVAIRIVGSAAVQTLVRRATDAHSGYLAGDRIGIAAGRYATGIHPRLSRFDDRRTSETNHYVEACRTKLLEVRRFA